MMDGGAGLGLRAPVVLPKISEYYSCDLNATFVYKFN